MNELEGAQNLTFASDSTSSRWLSIGLSLGAVAMITACSGNAEKPPTEPSNAVASNATPATASTESPGQWYRAALDMGEEIPPLAFFFELPAEGDQAIVVNGDERVPFDYEKTADGIHLSIDWNYETDVTAKRTADGRFEGQWRRNTPLWGVVTLPFSAEPIDAPKPELRYPGDAKGAFPVAGKWQLQWEEMGPGRAQFEEKDGGVTGFVRVGNLSDLRFMAGNVHGKELILSTFNGNAVNLVKATLSDDGQSMSGVMSIQNHYFENFTGKRVDEFPELPNITIAKGKSKLSHVAAIKRVAGSPALVIFFATWCSGCNDAFPYFTDLAKRYRDKGVKVLGLAYNLSDDKADNERQVAAFRKKYHTEFEVVTVETTPEEWAGAMPPELEGWDGFPVLVFLGPDGTVKHLWGGWYGPAAPKQNEALRQKIEGWMTELAALKKG